MRNPLETWVEAASLKELGRRNRKLVHAAGQDIALFLVGEKVYALRDACIHKGKSLSKGTVFHGKVVCPGHQWQFDPETGWVEEQEQCQPTYAVKVDGETVYVNPVPVTREAPQP